MHKLKDGPNILVIGDAMLDTYWHGDAQRLSPEAPVPIVDVRRVDDRAGGAGNVAMNLVALGARCTLLTILGADDHRKRLLNAMPCVNVADFVSPNVRTTAKLRIVSGQQIVRCDHEDIIPLDDEQLELMRDAMEMAIGAFDAVILSDYDKGLFRNIHHSQEIVSICHAAGVPVYVDSKLRHGHEQFRNADMLKVNSSDYSKAYGPFSTHDQMLESFDALRLLGKHQSALITMGKDGMAMSDGSTKLVIPSFAREVYDVSGAGDTVIAAYAFARAMIRGGEQSWLEFASAAASVVVGKQGTATATLEEIRSTGFRLPD